MERSTRQYLNDRKYIYLIEFKPSFLSGGEAKKKITDQGWVLIDTFRKRYHGWQIQSGHKMDCSWIFETLKEYGKVGEIQEYEYTSDPGDLPSRPMNYEETNRVEAEVKNKFKLSDLFWPVLLGIAGLLCLRSFVSSASIGYLVGGIFFWGLDALVIKGTINLKKAGAQKEFSRDDWVTINAICCNTWFETKDRYETGEDGQSQTVEHCDYFYEVAAGNFALDRILAGDKHIGDSKKLFYNKKTGELKEE